MDDPRVRDGILASEDCLSVQPVCDAKFHLQSRQLGHHEIEDGPRVLLRMEKTWQMRGLNGSETYRVVLDLGDVQMVGRNLAPVLVPPSRLAAPTPALAILRHPLPSPHPRPSLGPPPSSTPPFPAPWHYELHFPCDPRGPGIARLTLRAVLTAHGLAELADRDELLTSELATNSVRHTKGPASVRLQWLHPVLRVSVWDMSPDLPVLPVPATAAGARPDSPGVHADGGRGLLILGAVADRWGGCATGDEPMGPGGKTLWFELALPTPPPEGEPGAVFAA